MKVHDRLEVVKLAGTVKNGQIVVEGGLPPEGTPVTVTVDERDLPPGPYAVLDENGELIMTPELEAELEAAEQEAERGEWIPLEELLARIAATR
jgi:hypothetical protein